MSAPSMPVESSAEAPASSQQTRKLTALERNNLKWEAHKEEIRRFYMDQDQTLKETMEFFKQTRGLDWR